MMEAKPANLEWQEERSDEGNPTLSAIAPAQLIWAGAMAFQGGPRSLRLRRGFESIQAEVAAAY
jgi:hypothetical protein